MTLPDIDLIEYCRLKFAQKNIAADKELERIAEQCAILDKEHPQQWFSFFADRNYLTEIAQKVYEVFTQEICVGDSYTKPILPIGMIVNRQERDSVVVKYHTYVVGRAINEPI